MIKGLRNIFTKEIIFNKIILLLIFIAIIIGLSGCGVNYSEFFNDSATANYKGVQKAIAEGADVNETNSEGFTPLMLLATNESNEYNKFDILATYANLVDSGANIYKKHSDTGKTALHYAILNNNETLVIALLQEGAVVDVEDKQGVTPLEAAYISGGVYLDTIIHLIMYGADVNFTLSEDHYTPLAYAISSSHYRLIYALMEGGADVNQPVGKNLKLTPFSLAIINNQDSSLIKYFLENGADIFYSNDLGQDILMLAGKYTSNVDVIKLLLQEGADVNKQDKYGKTSLIYACQNVSNENTVAHIIKLLLEHGADPSILDGEGKKAIDYLIKRSELHKVLRRVGLISDGEFRNR